MSINRSQRPISPQQMFQRLISQSYRQFQCQDQVQKSKQQREVLFQLINQYQKSIESQLFRINQSEQLEKIKSEKIFQLERLKKQRQIIQQEIQNQFRRLTINKQQQSQKCQMQHQLHEIKFANSKIKIKLRDLFDYVQRLEIHNAKLQDERNVIQDNVVRRMRANSEDWRQNADLLRKQHQVQQNQYKAKLIQKQSQNIKNIRFQQQQISQRNQKKWDEFRKLTQKPSILPVSIPPPVLNYPSRRLPQRNFQRFRVI